MAANNNTISIVISEAMAASYTFIVNSDPESYPVVIVSDWTQFNDVYVRSGEGQVHVDVVPRDISEPAHVKAEGDGMTATPIKQEDGESEVEGHGEDSEMEDADILLTVDEYGLARELRNGEIRLLPTKEEDVPARELRNGEPGLFSTNVPPKKEENAGRGVDMSIAPWEPRVVGMLAESLVAGTAAIAAVNAAVHKHDTRYQRRQHLRQENCDSISPSRFHSRPYVHKRPAISPRQQDRLRRVARAALKASSA